MKISREISFKDNIFDKVLFEILQANNFLFKDLVFWNNYLKFKKDISFKQADSHDEFFFILNELKDSGAEKQMLAKLIEENSFYWGLIFSEKEKIKVRITFCFYNSNHLFKNNEFILLLLISSSN